MNFTTEDIVDQFELELHAAIQGTLAIDIHFKPGATMEQKKMAITRASQIGDRQFKQALAAGLIR